MLWRTVYLVPDTWYVVTGIGRLLLYIPAALSYVLVEREGQHSVVSQQ